MPRVLRDKISPWPWAGALAAVASLAALLRGAMMPDLDTQVTAMSAAWYVLYLLRYFLAPMRRYSEHWVVQYGAMAPHYLLLPLAVYAVNTVRSSSDSATSDVVQWCTAIFMNSCLLLMYGPVHSAYTLGDGPFHGLRFFYALYCWFSLWSLGMKILEAEKWNNSSLDYLLLFSSVAMYGVIASFAFLPYKWSADASQLAHDAKACAEWMKEEAKSVSPFFDGDANNGLVGCKYPIITMKIGENRKIKSVSTYIGADGTVPYIFLSYIFFKLVARRYIGLIALRKGTQRCVTLHSST